MKVRADELQPADLDAPERVRPHESSRAHKRNSSGHVLAAKVESPERAIFGEPLDRVVKPDCTELAVECWCGLNTVWIPQAEAGKTTRACGRTKCAAPDGIETIVGEKCPRGSKGKR